MTARLREEIDESSLHVSRVGNPRPVERNLVAELNQDAEEDQDVASGDRPPLAPRAKNNVETLQANRVLGRLVGEMKAESKWIKMFKPAMMCQTKWTVLGEELTQPVNSLTIDQLAEDTVLLLRAMGYKCTTRPSKLMLADWNARTVGIELMKSKRKLKELLGVQGGSKGQVPKARRAVEEFQLDEEKAPVPKVSESYKYSELSEDPSRVPLPKTPETKQEIFRRTETTPFFDDSHMQTPSEIGAQRAQHIEMSLVEATGEEDFSEDDDYADRRELDESPHSHIRQLSFDGAESERGQMLEIRTHASLEKIATLMDDAIGWMTRCNGSNASSTR